MNNDQNSDFSSRFDKKYIGRTILWALITAISIVLMVLSIHFDWAGGVLGVIFTITSLFSLFMTLKTYRKAVKEGAAEEGLYLVFLLLGKGINILLAPIVKILIKLGLISGKSGSGIDEHSFIFDFGRKGSRNRGNKMAKWKDLTDNRQKVRFIFTKHVNHRIKKGYRFNKSYTPNELEKDMQKLLKEDEDISLLFSCYRTARYQDPERTEFDDDLIIELKEKY